MRAAPAGIQRPPKPSGFRGLEEAEICAAARRFANGRYAIIAQAPAFGKRKKGRRVRKPPCNYVNAFSSWMVRFWKPRHMALADQRISET